MKNENRGTGLEDKVDRYLLGYMDAEERSAFESEMSSDAGLKEEVSVRSMVISAVQERQMWEFNLGHNVYFQKNGCRGIEPCMAPDPLP